MSTSSDPRHFFQTSAALSESERKAAKSKNSKGDPIKLRSKILACVADPVNDGRVYVSQAGGIVEHVEIETGEVLTTYSGPNAPLPCLTVSEHEIFAGCWDKAIYAWNITQSSSATRTPQKHSKVMQGPGHTDFVKALLLARVGGKSVLISGSADAVILVWDLESGQKLHTLKGHARGVQSLAIDPVESTAETVVFISADSSREIRRWRFTATKAAQIALSGPAETAAEVDGGDDQSLIAHETSVYALHFDADGDLWTASADKTAKCLVRTRKWEADMTLTHPDFVRDVIVDEDGGWVITACRDEEVRVWERGSGKLFHTFSGHFEEVTGLVLLGRLVVSVSIDATVRKWSLKPEDLKKAKEEAEAEKSGTPKVEEATTSASMLTEEEERELAELMDDDD